MYIVEIIPITKGIPQDTLTYFTSKPVPRGAVVEVTIRNKIVPGLIVSLRDAISEKTDLKAASFSIKKIGNTISSSLFTEEFLEAVQKTADYFAGTVGTTLKTLVPTIAFLAASKTKSDTPPPLTTINTQEKKEPTGGVSPNRLVLQAGEVERFDHYRSIVRGEFAQKKSVLMVLPTIEEAKRAAERIEKGIEHYTILFHGKLGKKELLQAWTKSKESQHPLLIIGTAGILSIPRRDIGYIIVERESSSSHKLISPPYLDVRFFARELAKATGATFLLGDILLRTETVHEVESGDLFEFAPMQWRTRSPATLHIVDMQTKVSSTLAPHQREKKPFRVIGDEIALLVQKTRNENARMIIYAGRKGLASTTVCADCNTVVSCHQCEAPMTLRLSDPEGKKDNYFVCNKCTERRPAAERCKHCDGWRLTPLGIGTELVEKELTERFPGISLIRIDKDTAPTETAAQKAITKFKATPGAILIGTELALLYADGPIEYAAIASVDSFFALPDFRITEKVFSLLLRIRNLAERECVIQTRMANNPIFEYARGGNLIDFSRAELSDRKQYHYPPDRLLIKISAEGKQEDIYEMMTELKKHLEKSAFTLEIYPAFIRTVKSKFILHGLLRLLPDQWPNQKLRDLLKSLPREFSVRVDPESLL